MQLIPEHEVRGLLHDTIFPEKRTVLLVWDAMGKKGLPTGVVGSGGDTSGKENHKLAALRAMNMEHDISERIPSSFRT